MSDMQRTTGPANPVEEDISDRDRMDRVREIAESGRETLSAEGYDDQRIIDWAESFYEERGESADADGFTDWVRDVRESALENTGDSDY
jgi:hypothetical protein